jgi:hypothetical protein
MPRAELAGRHFFAPRKKHGARSAPNHPKVDVAGGISKKYQLPKYMFTSEGMQ